MKLIFRGSRVVVYLASEREIRSMVEKGLVAQREGKYIDKNGREVIFVNKPFRSWGFVKTLGPGFEAFGSVNAINGINFSTNWHVIEGWNRIQYCENESNCVDAYPVFIFKPIILPRIVYEIAYLIRRLFKFRIHFGSSLYDYAILATSKPLGEWVKAQLIYTAGTCDSLNETDCLGVALKIPSIAFDYGLAQPNTITIGDTVGIDCTFHNFTTTANVIDIGEADVWYNSGVATFDIAYLLKFTGKPGIPGCSGSPVYKVDQKEDGFSARVAIRAYVVKNE